MTVREEKRVIYEIFQEQDLEKTISCIVDVFSSSEPLAKVVGITQDEFYPFAKIICKKAVKDGLSHIAKDYSTGEVIGFIISEKLIQENNEQSNQIFDDFVKFIPILSLLAQLEEQYMSRLSIEEKEHTLHCFMVGVQASYRNQNIAKYLIDNNIKNAKKFFLKAICEATGIISQHIFLQLGFKEIVAIEYQDYEYQGVKIFGNLAPHKKCILMEKILDKDDKIQER
ncbi:MAG: GNAT family N-acetyltransferase [Microcoleus sp.]